MLPQSNSTVLDNYPKPVLENLVEKLKEKTFARRPHLAEILYSYGDLTLYEFAKYHNHAYTNPTIEQRKHELIQTFKNEVERLLGSNVAKSCAKQLETTYRINTTDHHGPISEPDMVNSDIHAAIPYINGDELIQNIMVLGCANVSFDNASFPRGLLFHSFANGKLSTNQLVFYPRAVRPCPVIYFPAYTTANIENAKKRIDAWKKDGVINTEIEKTLDVLLNEIYADPEVLKSTYFSEQVTKTNYKIWKKFMGSNKNAPNLVYIEQEGLVNTLLDTYHLNQDTFIHRILFTPLYHDLIVKHFDGILRGFSIKDRVGTYLFWARPFGQKYRVQLWLQGDFLATEDGSYKIPLTPEGIHTAIVEKELIPSTLISFMLLSFYYGVRLVGGTSQTTYLTQMKQAFINMQKEYGDKESIAFAEKVPTTDLSVAVQSLAFLQAGRLARIPATGVDFILYGNEATIPIMQQVAKTLTVRETFYRALPDCYKWYYKEEEREQTLLEVTKEQMEEYLHIENKIVPSAKIA